MLKQELNACVPGQLGGENAHQPRLVESVQIGIAQRANIGVGYFEQKLPRAVDIVAGQAKQNFPCQRPHKIQALHAAQGFGVQTHGAGLIRQFRRLFQHDCSHAGATQMMCEYQAHRARSHDNYRGFYSAHFVKDPISMFTIRSAWALTKASCCGSTPNNSWHSGA